MFREMRRIRQQLPPAECEAILFRGSSGVLAVSGDDGYPYAVPLSYVYDGGKIYFHCAKQGHKLDAVARCDKVSFCVTDRDDVVPEEYTTHFRSVIVFGRARVLEDEEEKLSAFAKLAEKYSPGEALAAGRAEELARQYPRVNILALTPEHLTGKECIEFVNARGEDKQ